MPEPGALTLPVLDNDPSGNPASGTVFIYAKNDGSFNQKESDSTVTDLASGGGGGGETNTASNAGTGGVGVYARKTGVDFEFKNINNGDGIAITDDTGNDEIDIAMNINGLTADGAPDGTADYIVTYDASASAHKKVLLDDLPGGGGGGGSHATASYEADEASNYTTTSTAFVDVDGTNFSLTLTVPASGKVLVGLVAAVSPTGRVMFNVAVDGTDHVADDGIITIQGSNHNGSWTRPLTGLTAGSRTLKLRWKVNTGTATLYAGAGTGDFDIHPIFWAIGID